MKQKFYVQHHDGSDYDIYLKDDIYGSCHEFKTFREAKKAAISMVIDDINELKYTLVMLRRRKKKDIK